MTTTPPKIIFLSHINEEADLAAVLKSWVEPSLDCDVFVSSDTEDILLGEKWLEKIDQALAEAKVFLILCSQRSIVRPWINFESGAAWIKDVPVIPVCHSGYLKADLPPPLSSFQALDLTDAASCEELLKSLAKHLGREKQVPPIDYNRMIAELDAAPAPSEVPEAARMVGGSGQYEPTGVARSILELFRNVDETTLLESDINAGMPYSKIEVAAALDDLKKNGIVRTASITITGDARIRLTVDGQKAVLAL